MAQTNKCENCIYYKYFIQPDFIINKTTLNCCEKYNEGIPKEIWDGKQDCKKYVQSLISEEEN